jgi:hypothetical protein
LLVAGGDLRAGDFGVGGGVAGGEGVAVSDVGGPVEGAEEEFE